MESFCFSFAWFSRRSERRWMKYNCFFCCCTCRKFRQDRYMLEFFVSVGFRNSRELNTIQNDGDAYTNVIKNETLWNEFRMFNRYFLQSWLENKDKNQYFRVPLGGYCGTDFLLVSNELQDTFSTNLKNRKNGWKSYSYSIRSLSEVTGEKTIILRRTKLETVLNIPESHLSGPA